MRQNKNDENKTETIRESFDCINQFLGLSKPISYIARLEAIYI